MYERFKWIDKNVIYDYYSDVRWRSSDKSVEISICSRANGDCRKCIFSSCNNIYKATCGDKKSNLPFSFSKQDSGLQITRYLYSLYREIPNEKSYRNIDL